MTTWSYPASWLPWWKRLFMPRYWPIIGKEIYTWKYRPRPDWIKRILKHWEDEDVKEINRFYDQLIIRSALSGPSKKQKELRK